MKAVQNPKVVHYTCLAKAFDHACSRTHSEYAPMVDFSIFNGNISLMFSKTDDGVTHRVVQVVGGKESDELHANFFGSHEMLTSMLAKYEANNGAPEKLAAEFYFKGFSEGVGPNAFNKLHTELAFLISAFLQKGTLPSNIEDVEEFWKELSRATRSITYLNKN
jgi:hypothetical protein